MSDGGTVSLEEIATVSEEVKEVVQVPAAVAGDTEEKQTYTASSDHYILEDAPKSKKRLTASVWKYYTKKLKKFYVDTEVDGVKKRVFVDQQIIAECILCKNEGYVGVINMAYDHMLTSCIAEPLDIRILLMQTEVPVP